MEQQGGTRPRWLDSVLVGLLLASVAGCTGEPRVLEPRSPPSHTAPSIPVPQTPLKPGYGRVVLDGTDAPLKITARADTAFVPPGSKVEPTRVGELCVTPCVVDLPVGSYKLYMTSADGSNEGDTDVLRVKPGLTYYRRAPGKFDPPTWIPVLPTVLISVAALGVLTGALMASSRNTSQQVAGYGVMVGSVAFGGVGGVLYYNASRGARQEGASTTWTVPLQTAPDSNGNGR